jgi:hypothetical protein
MTDKSTLSRTFNSHFFEFLDDILTIFPENSEIKTARSSFEMIKKANPSAIIKVWFSYVYTPYRDVIESGNIEFFFEKDYGNDLSNLSNSNEIMKIIDKIRGPIKSMGKPNQDISMKYIQNLSKLSVLYQGT